MPKRASSKRELIDTGRNKMSAKRDARGLLREMEDVGRPGPSGRRKSAKTAVKSGQANRGDRKR